MKKREATRLCVRKNVKEFYYYFFFLSRTVYYKYTAKTTIRIDMIDISFETKLVRVFLL